MTAPFEILLSAPKDKYVLIPESQPLELGDVIAAATPERYALLPMNRHQLNEYHRPIKAHRASRLPNCKPSIALGITPLMIPGTSATDKGSIIRPSLVDDSDMISWRPSCVFVATRAGNIEPPCKSIVMPSASRESEQCPAHSIRPSFTTTSSGASS